LSQDNESAKVPNPEVVARPLRRTFSTEYKQRMLAEADGLTKQGQMGALLRREGLHSSNFTDWRRELEEGLGPRERALKPATQELYEAKRKLERENVSLRRQLAQAKALIEIQKKVSMLLGLAVTSEIEETPSSEP